MKVLHFPSECAPVIVDDEGRIEEWPKRADFPDTTDGMIDYLRARNAYNDRIAAFASLEFSNAFRKALKEST